MSGAGAGPGRTGAEPQILWRAHPDMRIFGVMAFVGSLMGVYPVLRLIAHLRGSGEAMPAVEIAFALIAVAIFLIAAFMLVVILLGGLRFEYRLEPGTFYVERHFLGHFRSRAYAVPGVRFFRSRKFSCLVQAGKPGPDGSWPATSTITLFSAAQRNSLRDALPEGVFP